MKTKSLGFIGGGRITRIFLYGFKNKNIEFPSIMVFDTNNEILGKLKNEFPKIKTASSPEEAAANDVVFIALHPPVVGETLSKLKDAFSKNTLIISLAPKISIQKLSDLTGNPRIARMIPNATSFVNLGFNPVCFAETIEASEKNSVMEVLKTLGTTFETAEPKLESYAIASAMLPTYFWFQWGEMELISQKMGLTKDESRKTIYETLKASLDLMYNSGLSYSETTDLIPVKPIGENEAEIKEILNTKLLGLFEKIKP